MATETLRPDLELSDVGLVANDHTNHNLDPDVSSVTVNATGNNVNTEWGGDFPTPTGNPTVGAGLQEFRVGVEQFDAGQSGTPTARIELWENGTLVRAGTNTNVTTYAVLSFTWNANEIATPDGSLVQCKLIGTKTGGAPSARNTVRIGHMEWNVTYDAGSVTNFKTVNFNMVTGVSKTTVATHFKSLSIGFVTGFSITKAVAKTLSVGFSTAMSVVKTIRPVAKSVSFVTAMTATNALLFTKSAAVSFITSMAATKTPVFVKQINVGFATAMSLTKMVKKTLSVGFATAMATVKTVKPVAKAVSFATGMAATTTLVVSQSASVSFATTMSAVKLFISGAGGVVGRVRRALVIACSIGFR